MSTCATLQIGSMSKKYNPVEYCQIQIDMHMVKLPACATICSQVDLIKTKITEIGELKDNWDGNGAAEVSKSIIYNAFKLLDNLTNRRNFNINMDSVVPTPDGTIDFNIESDKGFISIEVDEKGFGFFTDFVNSNNYASDLIASKFNFCLDADIIRG